MKRSKSTPADVRLKVLVRDEFRCVAKGLGAPGECRDRWGTVVYGPSLAEVLTVDHVLDDYSGMSMMADSDLDHLASICPAHHQGAGPTRQWSTSRDGRRLIRRYLALVRTMPSAQALRLAVLDA